MIGMPSGTKVWIAAGATDMRRGFDGLAALVQTQQSLEHAHEDYLLAMEADKRSREIQKDKDQATRENRALASKEQSARRTEIKDDLKTVKTVTEPYELALKDGEYSKNKDAAALYKTVKKEVKDKALEQIHIYMHGASQGPQTIAI